MATRKLSFNLLRNRSFVLALGMGVGLLAGPHAAWTARLTLPALALVMTASATLVPTSALTRPRGLLRSTALAVAMSYGLGAGAILLLAHWLVPPGDLWTGFVLIAATPPAVAVLPFSASLGGDAALAMGGMAGAHLAALAIAPLLTALLVGPGTIQPARLLAILVELVVAPFLVSRLLRGALFTAEDTEGAGKNIESSAGPAFSAVNRLSQGQLTTTENAEPSRFPSASSAPPAVNPPRLAAFARWRGSIIDWGMFVVVLASVAVNRDLFLREPAVLVRAGAVCVLATFGLGTLLDLALRGAGVGQKRVTLGLFATVKNWGFATATALALAGERASAAGAALTAVTVAWLIWLEARRRPPTVPPRGGIGLG